MTGTDKIKPSKALIGSTLNKIWTDYCLELDRLNELMRAHFNEIDTLIKGLTPVNELAGEKTEEKEMTVYAIFKKDTYDERKPPELWAVVYDKHAAEDFCQLHSEENSGHFVKYYYEEVPYCKDDISEIDPR